METYSTPGHCEALAIQPAIQRLSSSEADVWAAAVAGQRAIQRLTDIAIHRTIPRIANRIQTSTNSALVAFGNGPAVVRWKQL
jgi:hypothetical protein